MPLVGSKQRRPSHAAASSSRWPGLTWRISIYLLAGGYVVRGTLAGLEPLKRYYIPGRGGILLVRYSIIIWFLRCDTSNNSYERVLLVTFFLVHGGFCFLAIMILRCTWYNSRARCWNHKSPKWSSYFPLMVPARLLAFLSRFDDGSRHYNTAPQLIVRRMVCFFDTHCELYKVVDG